MVCTLVYLSIIVLIPLGMLPFRTASMGWDAFWETVLDPRVVASYRLTLTTSFMAACVNAIFGLIVAWVLVRYDFVGRRLIDALVDLPFALPTAVAGITLTTLYAPNGWLGKPLSNYGFMVAFTPSGITIALIFIGLPFVIRTLQPVIEDLDLELEEAATSLGASRWHVIRRVILPYLYPAWLTGFTLAFGPSVSTGQSCSSPATCRCARKSLRFSSSQSWSSSITQGRRPWLSSCSACRSRCCL